MRNAKDNALLDHCADLLQGSDNRAVVYWQLGLRLGLGHFLRPEANPTTPPLPKTAPELYKHRLDRYEKPHAFIQRVYAEWYGRGLAKNHLLSLDRSLYFALARQLGRHGCPEGFDLPTQKELNDRFLADMGLEDGETLPCPSFGTELKEQIRLYYAARNRAKKPKE